MLQHNFKGDRSNTPGVMLKHNLRGSVENARRYAQA